MADSSAVTTKNVGDVTVITLDDGKANALNFDVISALGAALDEGEKSKAVVIAGREGKFSAGFDLKIMTSDINDARNLLSQGAELALRVLMFGRPVVLGVTGHALAMGGILTTAADYRVGAEGDYKLGLNEVAIGMPVPKSAIELTRNRLAKKWFTRCIQHAHLCSPAEAVDAGFLDETTALDNVEARALEVATALGNTVHEVPFRTTRTSINAELADAVSAGIKADHELFNISQ